MKFRNMIQLLNIYDTTVVYFHRHILITSFTSMIRLGTYCNSCNISLMLDLMMNMISKRNNFLVNVNVLKNVIYFLPWWSSR